MKPTVFTKKQSLKAVICAVSVLLFFIIVFLVNLFIKNNRLQIAFYGLNQNVTEALQSIIIETKPNAKFTILDSAQPLPKNVNSKYKILFTYNGKSAENFITKAKTLPPNFYRLLPSSIAKQPLERYQGKIVPVLLDHYEIAFYKTYRDDAFLTIPQTLDQYENYLREMKKIAIYPLLCAGAEDDQLFGFVSTIAHSLLGSEGYSKMTKEIIYCNDKNYDFPQSFKDVLNEIKKLQTNGYTHKNWFQVSNKDIEHFMQEHTIATLSMSLSEHRNKKPVLIKYYESTPLMPKDSQVNHGLIAPQIVAMMFKDKAGASATINTLILTDNQRKLSDLTRLAPVNARAEPHDRQSDDVRFWASANPTGTLNDIGLECCDNPLQRKKFAQEIRDYLKL